MFPYGKIQTSASHEQIVIGLLTNAEGCPVAVEVFGGNTQDASTVEGKVKELREKYGVSELVLAEGRLEWSIDQESVAAAQALDGCYVIQWHFKQRLAPLFEQQATALAGKKIQAKDRAHTLASILETLKSQRRNQVRVGEAVFAQITEPTAEVRSILELLAVAPSPTL